MASKTMKYGIISDADHPYQLRLALASFRKNDVDSVLSLGGTETNLKHVEYSFDAFGLSEIPTHFYGLNIDAVASFNYFTNKQKYTNLHLANNIEHKVKNGNHEIVFLSRDDIKQIRAKGNQFVKDVIDSPEKTIIATHLPVIVGRAYTRSSDVRSDSLSDRLYGLGVKKFISASECGPLYLPTDMRKNKVEQVQETGELIWNAGSLKDQKCGILSVFPSGKVAYENLEIAHINPGLFRKTGVFYPSKSN